jgi:hypothetical protein
LSGPAGKELLLLCSPVSVARGGALDAAVLPFGEPIVWTEALSAASSLSSLETYSSDMRAGSFGSGRVVPVAIDEPSVASIDASVEGAGFSR